MQEYEKWLANKEIKASQGLKSKKKKSENGEHLLKTDIERKSAEEKMENPEMEDYFKQLEWNGVAP